MVHGTVVHLRVVHGLLAVFGAALRTMRGMVMVLRCQRARQCQQGEREPSAPHASGLTVTTCIMPACMW